MPPAIEERRIRNTPLQPLKKLCWREPLQLAAEGSKAKSNQLSRVLAAGVEESGCTVHFADDTYDTGPILVQNRVPVLEGDTPDSLAARVFVAECEAYPEAIRMVAKQRGV